MAKEYLCDRQCPECPVGMLKEARAGYLAGQTGRFENSKNFLRLITIPHAGRPGYGYTDKIKFVFEINDDIGGLTGDCFNSREKRIGCFFITLLNLVNMATPEETEREIQSYLQTVPPCHKADRRLHGFRHDSWSSILVPGAFSADCYSCSYWESGAAGISYTNPGGEPSALNCRGCDYHPDKKKAKKS